MNIILLLDAGDSVDAIFSKLPLDKINKVFLCPLSYPAQQLSSELYARLFNEKKINVEKVDFLTEFNQEAFENKKAYVEFIHQVGTKPFGLNGNLKSYFLYPGGSFSLWWGSVVAEKSPYKTHAFTIFSKILTILHLKKKLSCDQIWFTKQSDPIASVLSTLDQSFICNLSNNSLKNSAIESIKIILVEYLRTARFALTLFKKILDAKKLSAQFKSNWEELKDCKVAVVTAFPFVDQKKLKDGIFSNIIYGGFQKSLEAHYGQNVAWLAMYAPINSSTWKESINIAEQAKPLTNLFLLEEWLGIRDFFKILYLYIIVKIRCLISIAQYQDCFNYQDEFSGQRINLWKIMKRDFFSSFMGKVLLWTITDYYVFEKAVHALPQGTEVFYFSEIQGWEKALNAACRLRKDIKCIGLQHTIVPLLYMSYFDHPNDLKKEDFVQCSPQPDYLGCVGEVTKNILEQNGFPKEKLFKLGGFRFENFLEEPKPITAENAAKNQITVAFANCAWENEEILWMLYHAFNDTKLKVRFLLKSHPICPVEKTIQTMGVTFNSEIFEFTNKSLQEIVPQSKLMIVKESSSIFWALYNNIPTVVPVLYNIADLCPLSGVKDLSIYVKNSKELQSSVERILNGQVKLKEGYRDFVFEYFDVYQDSKKYYSNYLDFVKKPAVMNV